MRLCLGVLTCFPHVASALAEGADADKRVLGEFDEGACPIRGGADADKRVLGEFDEGAGPIRGGAIRGGADPGAYADKRALGVVDEGVLIRSFLMRSANF